MKRFITWASGVIFLLGAAVVLAAVPPRSAEELQEQSTHIVIGQVESVYARTVESEPGVSNTEVVAAIRVHCIDKGEGLEPGSLAYVHSWEPAARPDGWAGHQGGPIPAEGAYVRLYLSADENGRLQILTPNGQDQIRPEMGPDGQPTNLCTQQ